MLKNATESASKIKTLELVSIDDSTDEIAETRAKALLKVLKDEGVANKTAKVVVRKADAAESTEIIRSGFLLNRSIVLR
ncbi:MAG: hypothetical protein H0A75_01405 [Candidatus Methanofishera endochildressiae]|uniref:OmpA-like domain-containing protein n=1 Tax=Candidatus Methanofishera endochildressiae TaxID=2738884 RepID=A0A7Z0MMT4_9GAMM|nr:hypothetical protein [Candidatus Methanofishera endochildressiae]